MQLLRLHCHPDWGSARGGARCTRIRVSMTFRTPALAATGLRRWRPHSVANVTIGAKRKLRPLPAHCRLQACAHTHTPVGTCSSPLSGQAHAGHLERQGAAPTSTVRLPCRWVMHAAAVQCTLRLASFPDALQSTRLLAAASKCVMHIRVDRQTHLKSSAPSLLCAQLSTVSSAVTPPPARCSGQWMATSATSCTPGSSTILSPGLWTTKQQH